MLTHDRKQNLIVFLFYTLFFLFFQSTSLYGGDAGDLVTAAYTGGIAHPPGYPLYSLIGYILGHLPVSTVAWRIGLLSSIPMAGAVALVYMLLTKITRHKLVSFLSTSILTTTYLIWLYGIVPEVFALHAFFTMSIVYVSYLFSIQPSKRKLQFVAFLIGLALTHHHIIVFALPVVIAFLWQQRTFIYKLSLRDEASIVMCGIFGLTPYLWAYIAAVRNAPIVWDDPLTLKNIIRLISRADYGSFQSGTAYGQDIRSRLLQFVAIGDLYLQDFSLLGVLLCITGAISGWFQNRKIAAPLIIGFLSTGPGYFFYASYLFTTAFHIATAERFAIPSYLFFTMLMGYGMYTIFHAISSATRQHAARMLPLVQAGTITLMLILPLSLVYSNHAKLSPLKYDRTAEKFGRDILRTVETGSVIFLQGDHPVFNTQYMYYTYSMRPDVKLVHMTKLLNGTGYRQLRKYYPELAIKKNMDSLPALLTFIETEYKDQPLYATIPFTLIPKGYNWVPYGLLYRLYKGEDIPPYPLVDRRNEHVWRSYQDPLAGSLGVYKNLMLSNVTDYYKDALVRRGLYGATYGKDYTDAISYYDDALRLDPARGSIFYLKGEAQIALHNCAEAEKLFKKGYSYRTDDPALYYQAMLSLSQHCLKDTDATARWQKKLDDLSTKQETQLQEL